MRTVFGLMAVAGFAGWSAQAQEALSYSFSGRAGLGYLSHSTRSELGTGFEYKGPVLRVEGTGRIEVQAMEDLQFGAIARMSFEKGTTANYDRLTPAGPVQGGGDEFGGTDLDLAVFAALPRVTLSYGDMETAFDYATQEIGTGASILDGGNAVWMNIGDAAGSAGDRGYPGLGPVTSPDLRTLRADVQLGEITVSASRSEGTTRSGADINVDAAGLVWRHEFEGTSILFGVGYDKGMMDRFRSFSFGLTSGGFNVVMNRIHREPIVINSGITVTYDTTFDGLSLSYDFGDVTLGVAHSSQDRSGDGVFEGKARAVFASWQARENIAVDFEYSQSDYRISSGDDVRKASVAVALEF